MSYRAITVALLAAATAFVACADPPGARALAEHQVGMSFRLNPEGRNQHVVVKMRYGLMEYRLEYAGNTAPDTLRAVADRLAACGQAPGDLLDVRVYATAASWPWQVEIHQATPGSEDCVRSVLSRLPLEGGLSRGSAIYLAARVTVDGLQTTQRRERDTAGCAGGREVRMTPTEGLPRAALPMTARHVGYAPIPDPGEAASRVTCRSTAPYTTLSLRYASGELVDVATDPPVACVEDNARGALRTVEDLGIPDVAPGHHGRDAPTRLRDWDEVSCALPVPLRAP